MVDAVLKEALPVRDVEVRCLGCAGTHEPDYAGIDLYPQIKSGAISTSSPIPPTLR